jgi:predicted nucleic-acid-binding protein
MIGLDTNVVVRYLAQDDRIQSPKAIQLIDSLSEEKKGFISLITVIEVVWVMQDVYQTPKSEMIHILTTLLQAQAIQVEQAAIVLQAIHSYANSNADFADCLIERSAYQAGCNVAMTFDKKAQSVGMQLI